MVTAAEANAMLPHSLALAGEIGKASIARGAGADRNAAEAQQQQSQQDAALRQLILGNQLKQGESKQAIQDKIAGLKQLQDSGMVPDGGQAGVEGVTVGKDPTIAIMAQQGKAQAGEGRALQAYAAKTLGPLQKSADDLSFVQDLLKNPNSVNDQQVAVRLARITEGPGARLLSSVIEHSGGKPTAAGAGVDFENFLRGGGLTALQGGQVQAIKDNVALQAKQLQQQATNAATSYHAQASFIAPHLQPEQHEAMFQSFAQPFAASMKNLTPAPNTAPNDPRVATQQTPAPGLMSRAVDSLYGLIKGPQAAQQQQTQQAAPSGGQTKNVGGTTYLKTDAGWVAQ